MNWLDTPITAALGRALVHFVWQGALIGALLAVMLAALRRSSAESRYLAASAAMLAMAASFVVTLVASGPERVGLATPVGVAFPWLHATPAAGGGSGMPDRPAATWAVALWLLGVLVLLLRRAGGWLTARRMLQRATVAVDARWSMRLDELRARMGVGRVVQLVESALAAAPSVMGWLRPVILVPAGWLMSLPVEQAETVLLHELAHVRRQDYLVNLLQSIVEDLLFYHPAVWWVGRVMRRERENCCDDAVVRVGGDRRIYVRTLASLEGMRAGEPALAASGGSLTDRIRRLARPPAGPRASAAPLVLAMALVCAGAALLPAWQSAGTSQPDPSEEAAPTPAAVADPLPAPAPIPQERASSPYEKWLTQDVAYIIRDEERAAFRALRTDEEREHFIEQFWERRGVAMKEEHYRRIAYANQQFGGADLAGWKTDRGRIYITYGPPDEKETHPSGERGGPPYEEWLYRKLEGIGDNVIVRFEDAERNGRFRITMDPRALHGEVVPPAAQENRDRLYQSGAASVRVGAGGATLMSVAATGAQVVLYRVSGKDGTGQPVLRDSRLDGEYSKLLTLTPGAYRLEAEVNGPSLEDQKMLVEGQLQVAAMEARLAAATRTYTAKHPNLLEMETEMVNLRTRLAYAEEQLRKAPKTSRLDFEVR